MALGILQTPSAVRDEQLLHNRRIVRRALHSGIRFSGSQRKQRQRRNSHKPQGMPGSLLFINLVFRTYSVESAAGSLIEVELDEHRDLPLVMGSLILKSSTKLTLIML